MAKILKHFKKNMMDDFQSRLDANTNSYYVFLSKHTEWDDEEAPDTTTNSVEDAYYKVRNELLYSKRVKSTDTANMIRKIEWSSNTTYSQYDHRDTALASKDFFVINTSNNVYKCLFNNANGYSTSEPTTISNTAFELADGYVWKYMYTITSISDTQFSTTDFVPIDANTNVQNSAIAGSIDIIMIDNGGQGYKSATGTIQQKVSNTIFRIENSNISQNNYYTDSSMYILSGNSQGSISTISSYVSNSSGRFVVTDSSMADVDITSEYLISPSVVINGDGSNASAYCTVNATSGAIESVKMINLGTDYSITNTQIVANTSYGNSAIVTSILPPPGGHGANPAEELHCDTLAVSVDFSNTESNTISTAIGFRQVGIIESPLDYTTEQIYFTNTTINHTLTINTTTTANAQFTLNETVTGQTSNATAIIAINNSSSNSIVVTTVQGTFSNTENIVGSNSSTVGTITSIDYPDVKYNSGTVLYYDNFEKVQRSNTSVETVKLLLKF